MRILLRLPILLFLFCPFIHLSAQETGSLKFEILDLQTQKPIPGKLVFLQEGKPIELGVSSRGDLASRFNTVYSASGEGEIEISAGTYEVWVGRGLEYTADIHQVVILPKKKQKLKGVIRRVVSTEGYVGGDMHLHTLTHSGHGDANMEERVISCLAEGLDWAVATDHNHNIDYDTVMGALDIRGKMATTVGNEVSTPIGHFNAYPLKAGDAPVNPDLHDANALFKLIRSKHGDSVFIQVNHPRYPDIDYFNLRNLDRYTGESEDSLWSYDFDGFELLNENTGWGWDSRPENPIPVLEDWFNFLNHGRRLTALGNSDSHTVIAAIAGVPRNYIRSSTDDPALLNEWELARNLKAGNVSVSRGLYVECATENEKEMGSLVKLNKGKLELNIRVQAPNWIQCDTVRIYANGEVIRTYSLDEKNLTVRFDKPLKFEPKVDTWYVVVASGSEGMAPLVADHHGPITPLGFTNPIWVDADGDGRFSSLTEQVTTLIDRFAAYPDSLLAALKNRPIMLPYALAQLRKAPVTGKVDLLSGLLPELKPALRPLMFQVLSQLPEEEFVSVKTEKLDPAIAALVRVRKKESLDYTALVALRKAMASWEAGDVLPRWYVLGPRPLSGLRGDQPVDLSSTWVLPEDTLAWKRSWAWPDGELALHRAGSFAYAELYSPEAVPVDFVLNHDMPLSLWLNEKLVAEAKTSGKQIITLDLEKGKNRFFIQTETSADPAGVTLEPIDRVGWLKEKTALKPVQTHLGFHTKVTYATPGSEKYSGGNDNPLSDGLRGSVNDFYHFWRGYEGEDMRATLDLGRAMPVNRVNLGCLSNPGAWIFFPKKVTFELSLDGVNWELAGEESFDLPEGYSEKATRDFGVDLAGKSVRYVRVSAESQQTCPAWHGGAGFKAWLFVDEVVVE